MWSIVMHTEKAGKVFSSLLCSNRTLSSTLHHVGSLVLGPKGSFSKDTNQAYCIVVSLWENGFCLSNEVQRSWLFLSRKDFLLCPVASEWGLTLWAGESQWCLHDLYGLSGGRSPRHLAVPLLHSYCKSQLAIFTSALRCYFCSLSSKIHVLKIN